MAAAQKSSKHDLALSGVERLGQLAALFAVRRRQLAESVGLTDQQWQVLEEVQDAHFMPSMFARQRESSAAAVSKILRQLTNKGLVVAAVSDGDARHRQYSLTSEGRALLTRLRRERERAIERVWMTFPEARLAEFARFAGELVERLDVLAAEARAER